MHQRYYHWTGWHQTIWSWTVTTELLVLNAWHRSRPPLESITWITCCEHRALVWWISINGQTSESSLQTGLLNCDIAKIRKYISFTDCKILIHAFITSKLDYYNSLLSGIRQDHINKLQLVQNSVARLLTVIKKHEHLRSLHWLPFPERINF